MLNARMARVEVRGLSCLFSVIPSDRELESCVTCVSGEGSRMSTQPHEADTWALSALDVYYDFTRQRVFAVESHS
jgi:hypothetical protein